MIIAVLQEQSGEAKSRTHYQHILLHMSWFYLFTLHSLNTRYT